MGFYSFLIFAVVVFEFCVMGNRQLSDDFFVMKQEENEM